LDRRLGGCQSRSERGGEEKKFLHCPFWELKSGYPARNLITILTELPWFWNIKKGNGKRKKGRNKTMERERKRSRREEGQK
jgi:hypothetical protein